MSAVKTLLLDIETAPNLGHYFDPWRENNIIHVERDWFILSFAFKWAGDENVTVRALPDFPGYKKNKTDDRHLCGELHGLLSAADVIVAHNGDGFDLPKICARLVFHGHQPPAPYKTVDTLKLARKYFKFDSNKLDSLCRFLKIGSKLPHTGTHLWIGCVEGKPDAWDTMREYNAHDVSPLLEGLYERIRGWGTHPKLSHITRDPLSCPTCQSPRTQKRGFRFYASGKKQLCQCKDCGHYFVTGPHIKLEPV